MTKYGQTERIQILGENMKTAVITGGNGYIGSHMAKLLATQGWTVSIIDNHSTSPDAQVHNFGTFHNIDIGDSDKVLKLLREVKPEVVFHFASRAIVSESQENPFLYYDEVLKKSISLIESCVNANVPHFIFSSTCATFGVHNDKISEETPQAPVNSYGLSKLMIEKILVDLASKNKLKSCALRYFNAVGSDPDLEIGENHEQETHLVPNLCLSGISGAKEFNIFGNNHQTKDGTCVRDYIHVVDLVRAHELAFNHLKKNKKNWNAFNLGTGQGESVSNVLKTFEKVTNVELNTTIKEARNGDPAYLVASAKKAKNELNFTTKYTLEDSIKHTWQWFNSDKANSYIKRE